MRGLIPSMPPVNGVSSVDSSQSRPARPFSTALYLVIVLGFSWPFQFAFLFLGESFRPLLLLSMLMAGAGTLVAGRYVFRDGFADAGWRLGRVQDYVLAFGLALFLWGVPVFLEGALGIGAPKPAVAWTSMVASFAAAFVLTLGPAFGEELSWRGYLLPRLMTRYSERQALLIHGFITWFWHAPFVATMALQMPERPLIALPLVFAISLVPTIMHAVVFAYLWSRSGSLLVATVYHSAFDEVRDTLQNFVGLGVLGDYWQAVVISILGALLLWRVPWQPAGVVRPPSPLSAQTESHA